MNERDELARLHGFDTYADLLDFSYPLPRIPRETAQCYVARHPRGHWFVWEDKIPAKTNQD